MPSMSNQTHYEILGVEHTATDEQIRKAYRKKSLETHPDKNNGDRSAFLIVKDAYDTLSDPIQRKAYDASLKTPSAGTTPTKLNAQPVTERRDYVEEERRRAEAAKSFSMYMKKKEAAHSFHRAPPSITKEQFNKILAMMLLTLAQKDAERGKTPLSNRTLLLIYKMSLETSSDKQHEIETKTRPPSFARR